MDTAGDGVTDGTGSTGVGGICEIGAGSATGEGISGSAGRGAGSFFGRATFTSDGVGGRTGRLVLGAGAGVLDLDIVEVDAFTVVLRSAVFFESVGIGAGVIVRAGRALTFRIGLAGAADVAGVWLRDTGVTTGLFPHAADRGSAARFLSAT